jgi:transcriptional regulator with XRE-family HTH domain
MWLWYKLNHKNELKTMFGEFIKQIRERQRLGLREFCRENGHDASDWSKIERELLPPPRDEETLRTRAKQLGLKQGSEDWLKFFDYAAVDSGRIPGYVLKDKKLVAQLPVFFRTISGQKPSQKDLEKLVKLIRRANRP